MENLLFLGVPILKHIRVPVRKIFGHSFSDFRKKGNIGFCMGKSETITAIGLKVGLSIQINEL